MRRLMVMTLVVFLVSLLSLVSFADTPSNDEGTNRDSNYDGDNELGDGIGDDPFGNDERNGTEYVGTGTCHGGNGYKTPVLIGLGFQSEYPILILLPDMMW